MLPISSVASTNFQYQCGFAEISTLFSLLFTLYYSPNSQIGNIGIGNTNIVALEVPHFFGHENEKLLINKG